MPFITEELWQSLKQRLSNKNQMPDSIMIASYPIADDNAIDPEAERAMSAIIEIVRSIRNARTEHKVKSNEWIEARVYAAELLSDIASQAKAIETLARARPLAILSRQERKPDEEKAIVLVLREAEVVLPWAGMADQLAAKKHLARERDATQARIAQIDARLRDNTFVAKAPPHIIEREKQKLSGLEDKLKRLKLELAQLG
jgi:valyl-tRNA synthetase